MSDPKAKKLGYFISKEIGKAISDYGMLKDKDKIAVGVSGGKDSLTLLKMLRYRQSFVPIKFDILAVHIDFGYPRRGAKLLIKYFQDNDYEYHIEKISLPKAKNRRGISCFWCAWNRRKALFQVAHKMGCNKVALGHHFDDIIETILLNLFYQGQISAMVPKQEMFDGKITIIRPLAYVEEARIKRYTKVSSDFPYEKCNCPNSDNSRRRIIEKLIKELEKTSPHIKKNIFRSIRRIKKDYLL